MPHPLRASIAALLWGFFALLGIPTHASAPTGPTAATYAAFVEAMRPRHATPLVAVLAHAEGTETTDFLVPHALLQRAGVQVVPVATTAGTVELMPALKIRVDTSLAQFDARYPQGADYVIVPAMHRSDDPQVLDWLRAQQQRGAIILGVCAGAQVLAAAGLLDGRGFTGHWWDRSALAQRPGAHHVANLRFHADGGIATTTGVSASIPATLALIEALQGRMRAEELARELGVRDWGPAHDSARYRLDGAALGAIVGNTLAFWRHETLALAVHEGSDDVALALLADAWSRTYRSQAVATGSGPVPLASGLTLLPQAPNAAQLPLSVEAAPAQCQLDNALRQMASRYGARTSHWVATQLEYPLADDSGDNCPPPQAKQSLSIQ